MRPRDLLDSGARLAIVDPLGVWWGLRASADGSAAGYPVVVFGGDHADVPITAEMGGALGRLPAASGDSLHPAARKLLLALAQHAPARFTWGQAATLAGLKPSGGHFNAGRKSLRESGYIAETNDLVSATASGLKAADEVPPAPSTSAERLALWCGRLPTPAPEMLRTLAAQGERYMASGRRSAFCRAPPRARTPQRRRAQRTH